MGGSKRDRTTNLSSYLKYAGRKTWFVPEIAAFCAERPNSRLVDLFTGSAEVPYGAQPRRVLINDRNPHVMNLHQWVQRGWEPDCSTGAFMNLFIHDEAIYYQRRHRFNELLQGGQHNTLEAAMLLYYMNRTGFNGLIRFSRKTGFNVPFGRYDKIKYLESFAQWHQIAADWELSSQDFATVPLEPTDIVYADPPYDSVVEDDDQLSLFGDEFQSTGNGFTGYFESFTWTDQVRLADFLALHPGAVFASNLATPRIVKLYQERGFSIREVGVTRSIAASGDARQVVTEMLAFRGATYAE
jgi:DNA adenine methylase